MVKKMLGVMGKKMFDNDNDNDNEFVVLSWARVFDGERGRRESSPGPPPLEVRIHEVDSHFPGILPRPMAIVGWMER